MIARLIVALRAGRCRPPRPDGWPPARPSAIPAAAVDHRGWCQTGSKWRRARRRAPPAGCDQRSTPASWFLLRPLQQEPPDLLHLHQRGQGALDELAALLQPDRLALEQRLEVPPFLVCQPPQVFGLSLGMTCSHLSFALAASIVCPGLFAGQSQPPL